VTRDYIRQEGKKRRLGERLMAVVAMGERGRIYLSPTAADELSAALAVDLPLVEHARSTFLSVSTPTRAMITGGVCSAYGLATYGHLFTPRQLAALSTFSDLALEVRDLAKTDATARSLLNEEAPHGGGGIEAEAYGDAVATIMAFALSRSADRGSSICSWDSSPKMEALRNTFGRQAIPMTWDYAEGNPFSESSGSWMNNIEWSSKAIYMLPASAAGRADQADASSQEHSIGRVVSTDPPYYDNIGYADLSDYFYVWLRRTLRSVFPGLFATLAAPKDRELVATQYRHGSKENAETFFLEGMTLAMRQIAKQSHPAFPVTIYYAFKQSETRSAGGTASTGWETFLDAVIKAGFALNGTWPIRTELANRMISAGTNALASSVVLVCQQRQESAALLSRNEFRRRLRQDLPASLKELERANIAPVDVAQAAIGPGMAIFSGAKAVLNPDDSPMSVREALTEINAALDEYLSQDEGDLDADSRFALTFFESFGYKEREFGDAENLAKARNLSVAGVAESGILRSVAGKVQLLQRSDLSGDWDPTRDKRLCVWEATQQLIKRLEADGEASAAALLLQLKGISTHGDLAANCRALAYRLYNHCEKTKQAEEARSYNGLVIAWPELERQASAASSTQSAPLQTSLI
jgi:putative DNA methylase